MKTRIIILIIAIIILIFIFVYFAAYSGLMQNREKSIKVKNMIKVTSSAFAQNALIPSKYTCKGDNINPPLLIENVPENAKSLALIVDDPDSPRGTFIHWILWNISPETAEIKENSIPDGAISGKNDFGNTNYGGPCPGSGIHRYFFTILALDIALNLEKGANRSSLDQAMQSHIIGQGQLMGKYSK